MEATKGMQAVSYASVTMAMLQSICAAVLTVSGIRVLIGLTALAAGSIYIPVARFHQDAIRIPMLTLATAGAVVNLAVLAWIWWMRSRPAAQWRRGELNAKQRRSERLQVALAVLTLLLVGLELWTHGLLVRRARAHHAQATNLSLRAPVEQPCRTLHRAVRGDAG